MALCLGAVFMFASQDAATKVLVRDYDVAQFVMVRFWVFAAFAAGYAIHRAGWRRCFATERPVLQGLRSLIMLAEIALFAFGLRFLGLADIHATFATFPLMVTALAPLVLGEKVGWRRWVAVAVGFIGALVVIRPGTGVFSAPVLIPLAAALMFAVYQVMTRLVSRRDSSATSLFYMGWVGALAVTPFGLAAWQPPTLEAWVLMAVLSASGLFAHFLLILALEYADAASLQPLNYFLIVWAIVMGYLLFDDLPDLPTLTGAAIIVASGLYTMFREHLRKAGDS
jgi:drug/metabolite transporter (DMT)-like permease